MALELVPKDKWENEVKFEDPQDGPLRYIGPDRRKTIRRIKVDRRAMVRFENTPDRRQGGDRRPGIRL